MYKIQKIDRAKYMEELLGYTPTEAQLKFWAKEWVPEHPGEAMLLKFITDGRSFHKLNNDIHTNKEYQKLYNDGKWTEMINYRKDSSVRKLERKVEKEKGI